jgi:hypothetical protein
MRLINLLQSLQQLIKQIKQNKVNQKKFEIPDISKSEIIHPKSDIILCIYKEETGY